MSYAGFCEQCQIPYYEMDALAHRHEPEPAAAPAVEPQKDELLGDIRKWIESNGNVTPSLLQRNFRIGYSRAVAAIESIEKEGLLKRIEQEKFNSFKWEWIKPEAVEPRPEMPPVNKKEAGLFWKFIVSRTDGKSEPGQKHDGCDYFVLDVTHDPFAIPAIQSYAAACKVEYSKLAEDLIAKVEAASMQQEPLRLALENIAANYGGCHCDHTTADCCEKAGEFCPHCIAEIALKSQPAAPRTQGRELELLREVEELKGWKESAISVTPPMQEIGRALGLKLGQSIHDKILPGIERLKKLAQARTQPAPKCPKCSALYSLKAEIMRTFVRISCINCEFIGTITRDDEGFYLIELAQFFTALPEATNRDKRQKEVAEWCAAAFGADHQSSVPQRAIRMLEEAIEAYQSATMRLPADDVRAKAHALVDHVMSRLAGNLAQECGGVGVTLLALCEAAGVSADTEELREIARVKSKPLEHFHQRNQAKNEAGFDLSAPSISASSAAVIALSKKENE